jgi:two-component system, chemotaxis family, chemotaxis protein CheY
MAPLSILVVDDVEAFARLIADTLRQAGHAVTCANNGRDAVVLLPKLRFDLVITDIIMPSGDGFELIDEVKRLQPEARILAISGGGKLYSAEACLQSAEQSGTSGILLKPFGPAELLDTVQRLFAGNEKAPAKPHD